MTCLGELTLEMIVEGQMTCLCEDVTPITPSHKNCVYRPLFILTLSEKTGPIDCKKLKTIFAHMVFFCEKCVKS